MKKLLLIFSLMASIFTAPTTAGDLLTKDLKVKLISIEENTGNILVQFHPRHSINGLACTDDYWASLSKNSLVHQEMLSVLLTAYASQKPMNITVSDDPQSTFCKLKRIILK